MRKVAILLILSMIFPLCFSGCVSKNEYEQLQQKFNDLQKKVYQLQYENEQLKDELKLYQDTYGTVHSGVTQLPYVGGSKDQLILVNNHTATNPTWQQLCSFLSSDETEQKLFIFSDYTSGDSAKELHDNAESHELRAAFVVVDIEGDSRYAVNAFKTTDKGLVFVDCNYSRYKAHMLWEMNSLTKAGWLMYSVPEISYDAIAYVKINKELGMLSFTKDGQNSYEFYEIMKKKWAECQPRLTAYNNKIENLNKELTPNNYWATPIQKQLKEIENEYNELKIITNQLIPIFESQGVVKNIDLYW